MKHESVLNESSTDLDTMIETVVEAVSRKIDGYCGRFFYSASETRYFTPEHPNRVYLSDVNSTASITVYTDDDGDGTYENTWAATDFNLLPANSALEGWPATYIETAINGDYSFPIVRNGLKIATYFGWAAVPKPVELACILQSHRLYKRLMTPLGQASTNALGVQMLNLPHLDPDIAELLEPYRRLV